MLHEITARVGQTEIPRKFARSSSICRAASVDAFEASLGVRSPRDTLAMHSDAASVTRGMLPFFV